MKALIGMSGGVDSSVAALLMLEAGYECIGATMRLYGGQASPGSKTCCSLDDVEDARSVAHRLGIKHYVFNFTEEFQQQVMDQFVAVYQTGGTPNPCIECNRYLKFGKLLQRARELSCDVLVSGHYAKVQQDPATGRYLLMRAADRAKDQTYFLACLSQQQLSRIRFPLGDLTKAQVRELAEKHGFLNARKHDSQDICFVPGGDYTAFLTAYTGKELEPGDFLNTQGQVVGRHRGAVCYTIGQRKGLGLAMGEPVYVCAKDMAAKTVTVGPNQALFSRELWAKDWVFFPFEQLTEPLAVTAKIRHSQFDRKATVYPEADGLARVVFDEPQRAISPGQAVVLYQGEMVIGGGTIVK
ncbi:MAG: tRNA 2-thiouridine(34) synthase MnmA [Firmicutes bacterium]|nr:tRNA 2-thiouridine(34) synthase MnmA [Bacillota bacterium]MDY6160823.1 tRNA 2-thiouridine(34) synthase MnmA [Candidatus Faecousia sp.]